MTWGTSMKKHFLTIALLVNCIASSVLAYIDKVIILQKPAGDGSKQTIILLADIHDGFKTAKQERSATLALLKSLDATCIVEDPGARCHNEFYQDPLHFDANTNLHLSEKEFNKLADDETMLWEFAQFCHRDQQSFINIECRQIIQDRSHSLPISLIKQKINSLLAEINHYNDTPELNKWYHSQLSDGVKLINESSFFQALFSCNGTILEAFEQFKDSYREDVIQALVDDNARRWQTYLEQKKCPCSPATLQELCRPLKNNYLKKSSRQLYEQLIINTFNFIIDIQIMHAINGLPKDKAIIVMAGSRHIGLVYQQLKKQKYKLYKSFLTNPEPRDTLLSFFTPGRSFEPVPLKPLFDELVVKSFLNDSPLKIANKGGRNPLIRATCIGQNDLLASIVQKGIPVDSQDKKGRTALMHAARHNNTHAVASLLTLGASPTVRDLQGRNALEYAIRKNATEAASYLIQAMKKEDCDIRNANNGFTPLMAAAFINQHHIAQELVKKGVNIEETFDGELTPYFIAIVTKARETAQMLANRGANTQFRPIINETRTIECFFYDIIGKGYERLIKEAVKSNIPVNLTDENTMAPLTMAILLNNPKAIKQLCLHGAFVNKPVKATETLIETVQSNSQCLQWMGQEKYKKYIAETIGSRAEISPLMLARLLDPDCSKAAPMLVRFGAQE